ncbi:beta-1,6-N-acetylglucosaminyltransferase [Pedobacter sp. Leaf250]|uniref:beta-1,6-N-acetylglucosaminyltransferase n=1 Tax=Pedobacter sp. Leaf250 TaxID=2876559 RepID=UPI001E33B881|nr:beta-1,6-N-acetylglucosaminyltransferase [Pedobacter sp. Leaf250]
MKIANIIMAYKNPQQIMMMLNAMEYPNFDFYIHVDKKVDIKDFLYLQDLPNVYFISNRTVCNWGGFQFVTAIFKSLDEVIQKNINYEFYNLLSAQDYPIKPMNIIADFFKDNIGKSFISYDMEGNEQWWAHAKSRYETYHFTDFKFRGKYFLQRLINYVTPKRKFPISAKLYGTCVSSWWSISKNAAVYLNDYVKNNDKLMRFMKYTWAADEFLIATLLMNSPHQKYIVNNNLRMITWEDSLPNPIILTTKNFDAISESKMFFARKFDIAVDREILIEIDQKLLTNTLV